MASVNLARSYKYGSKPFGQKKWYKDDFDVVSGLRSNEARRKFRFGLKTNIEFLIQLDLENLKECLTKAGFPLESTLPENSHKILSNGSFLDLMRKANQKNFNEFCKIFNRVLSNMHFSQSLSEFFATDDMLDPALSLISEAIRNGPNLNTTLRGGSFASAALIYRHRAPKRDHDFCSIFTSARSTRPSVNSQKKVKFEPKEDDKQDVFTRGYCHRFQLTNKCEKKDCTYRHKCCTCQRFST